MNEPSHAGDRSHGYRTFGQLAQEVEAVVDVVWVTASRKTAWPTRKTFPDQFGSEFTSILSPRHSVVGLHVLAILSFFFEAHIPFARQA